ncbi:MAG: hypothetical protein ACK4QL_09300 [Pseudanabaenaceae cyanobacterium]
MKKLAKVPGLSLVLIVVSYALFGWLLSIHKQPWEVWIPTGAVCVGVSWFTALAWAVAAIAIVFAKQKILLLSLGLCLIWAILMYIARIETQAFWENRTLAGINLAFLSALGLFLGWYLDANLLKSLGENLLK